MRQVRQSWRKPAHVHSKFVSLAAWYSLLVLGVFSCGLLFGELPTTGLEGARHQVWEGREARQEREEKRKEEEEEK